MIRRLVLPASAVTALSVAAALAGAWKWGG